MVPTNALALYELSETSGTHHKCALLTITAPKSLVIMAYVMAMTRWLAQHIQEQLVVMRDFLRIYSDLINLAQPMHCINYE